MVNLQNYQNINIELAVRCEQLIDIKIQREQKDDDAKLCKQFGYTNILLNN